MKRTILALLLLAGFIAIPVMAQDFSSPKAQFLSFTFGAGGGYDLANEGAIGVKTFGFSLAVIDDLEIGYLFISGSESANFFRLGYNFTDKYGAALGLGAKGSAPAAPAVLLGVYGNFFQQRAENGMAYSLGFGADYTAATDDLSEGSLLLTLRVSFGL